MCAQTAVTDAGSSTVGPIDVSGRSRAVKERTSTLAEEEPDDTTVDVGAVHELDLVHSSTDEGGEVARQVKASATTVAPELDWHVTVRVRVPVSDEHNVAVHADQELVAQ